MLKDEAAFTELWKKYYHLLLGIAKLNGASREEAEDVLQDVFLWLWDNREAIEIKPNTFGSYLKQTVRNRTRKLRRHKRVRAKHAESVLSSGEKRLNPAGSAHELLEALELQRHIEAKIETLSPRSAQVFRLSGEGLTNGEIAEAMGIGKPTVESKLSHAKRCLRDVVREWNGFP